ncbi:MAG: helix-turn-helix transcriptional regulator, partial [Dehalococcoidia bacterium]
MDWSSRRHARGRPPHPDVLTPAEWRVLEGVREGRSNAEIGERLDVSVNTVRTHVSSMLTKLELPDRRALAAWVGAPAPVSARALDRFGLLAPWLRLGAAGTAAVLAGALLWMALDGGRGGAGGASEDPTATP